MDIPYSPDALHPAADHTSADHPPEALLDPTPKTLSAESAQENPEAGGGSTAFPERHALDHDGIPGPDTSERGSLLAAGIIAKSGMVEASGAIKTKAMDIEPIVQDGIHEGVQVAQKAEKLTGMALHDGAKQVRAMVHMRADTLSHHLEVAQAAASKAMSQAAVDAQTRLHQLHENTLQPALGAMRDHVDRATTACTWNEAASACQHVRRLMPLVIFGTSLITGYLIGRGRSPSS